MNQTLTHPRGSIFVVRMWKVIFRQRLHGTKSVWNRYEIGTDKLSVYTGPGGSGLVRICYLVPNESTYEGDPYRTLPFQFRTGPV